MVRVNKILNHDLFSMYLSEIEELEKNRIFCRHNLEHFLTVARIAMILNLQEKLNLHKEIIYAAALLHDIGRHLQYNQGIPHEQASAELAVDILADCEFDEKETDVILKAIGNHRNKKIENEKSLDGIIYRADKMSRPCYQCNAVAECHPEISRKHELIV